MRECDVHETHGNITFIVNHWSCSINFSRWFVSAGRRQTDMITIEKWDDIFRSHEHSKYVQLTSAPTAPVWQRLSYHATNICIMKWREGTGLLADRLMTCNYWKSWRGLIKRNSVKSMLNNAWLALWLSNDVQSLGNGRNLCAKRVWAYYEGGPRLAFFMLSAKLLWTEYRVRERERGHGYLWIGQRLTLTGKKEGMLYVKLIRNNVMLFFIIGGCWRVKTNSQTNKP